MGIDEACVFGVVLFVLLVLFGALAVSIWYHRRHPEDSSRPMTPEEWEDWLDDLLFPPLCDLYTDNESDDESDD